MSDEDKALTWKLVEIGVVGTLISIPIGLWAIPKYKDKTWMAAAILTGVGFVVKEWMLHEKDTETA